MSEARAGLRAAEAVKAAQSAGVGTATGTAGSDLMAAATGAQPIDMAAIPAGTTGPSFGQQALGAVQSAGELGWKGLKGLGSAAQKNPGLTFMGLYGIGALADAGARRRAEEEAIEEEYKSRYGTRNIAPQRYRYGTSGFIG
jgi:hypothetical protein